MKLEKLTPLLVVDTIEPCLATFEALGYAVAVRVPETGTLGFVILSGSAGELMMQTRESLAEDLPAVLARKPALLLYGNVDSLSAAEATLPDAQVLVPERKTFYGATEIWFELPGGKILGLAEHRS
jgi:hypothetical protein